MENQEINIAEILEDCPKGTKLYSPAFGSLSFICIRDLGPIIECEDRNGQCVLFYNNGSYRGDECMLFPSKDQRNWSRFEPKQPVSYFIGSDGKVRFFKGEKTEEDEKRAKFGNEFPTHEAAEYAAGKVKELLLSLRKEEKK